MVNGRSVVLNGDLGSGKSTVSVLLAERLGIRRISIGDLYRQMAEERGLTALQLNLHAELDDKIDNYVDQLQGDIAASGEQLVVDSRLAWFFFRDALKVHLIADPIVAARRALGRPADTVESYASVEEALDRLAVRSESERMRFLQRYGADKTRLRNYDLVCDSTRATPDELVDRITEALHTPPGETKLWLDPARIDASTGEAEGPLQLGYARPHFFTVTGAHQVRTAAHLVEGTLLAEADEPINGIPATRWLTPSR